MPLSSSLTVMIRTVLPISWALMLIGGLFVHVPPDLESPRRILLAALGVLLLEWALWSRRLKDVEADTQGLVISSGGERVRVPWSRVAAIERPWWGKDGMARIRFVGPTVFGPTILFMMSFDPFTRWRNHHVVRTVNDHLAAARPRSVGG
jgi:hypothetical protein